MTTSNLMWSSKRPTTPSYAYGKGGVTGMEGCYHQDALQEGGQIELHRLWGNFACFRSRQSVPQNPNRIAPATTARLRGYYRNNAASDWNDPPWACCSWCADDRNWDEGERFR